MNPSSLNHRDLYGVQATAFISHVDVHNWCKLTHQHSHSIWFGVGLITCCRTNQKGRQTHGQDVEHRRRLHGILFQQNSLHRPAAADIVQLVVVNLNSPQLWQEECSSSIQWEGYYLGAILRNSTQYRQKLVKQRILMVTTCSKHQRLSLW